MAKRKFLYSDLYEASKLNLDDEFEKEKLLKIFNLYVEELNENKKFLIHTLLLLSNSKSFMEDYSSYILVAFDTVEDVKEFFEDEIRRNLINENPNEPIYFLKKLFSSFGVSDRSGTYFIHIFKRILQVYEEKELLFEVPKCKGILDEDFEKEFKDKYDLKKLSKTDGIVFDTVEDVQKVKKLFDIYYKDEENQEKILELENLYQNVEQTLIKYLFKFENRLKTDVNFANSLLSKLSYNSDYILNVERYIIYSNFEVINNKIYNLNYMNSLQKSKKSLNNLVKIGDCKITPYFAYFSVLGIFLSSNLYNMFMFKSFETYSDYKMILPIFYEIIKVLNK